MGQHLADGAAVVVLFQAERLSRRAVGTDAMVGAVVTSSWAGVRHRTLSNVYALSTLLGAVCIASDTM